MTTPNPLVIVTPYAGVDFYSNREVLYFTGTMDLTGIAEIVGTATTGTLTIELGSGTWTALWEGGELGGNRITFTPYSSDATPLAGPTTVVNVTLIDTVPSDIVAVPTALQTDISSTSIFFSWEGNSEENLVGYNVYASESVGGGASGYTLLNSVPISDPWLTTERLSQVSQEIVEVGGSRTTTTVEAVIPVERFRYEISEFDGEALVVGQTLHFVVTAIVYDPATYTEIESNYSGELSESIFNLATINATIPTRTRDVIVSDYVEALHTADSLLDIKPGTTSRDIHVEPPSNEFEKAYFLWDFAIRSQTFATLMPVDDADGDGVSDPVSLSPYKLALQVALNGISDAAVQTFIDERFDALASRYGLVRQSATKAHTTALYYRTDPPQKDVEIAAGRVVSTVGNTSQGVFSQQFITTASFFVSLANVGTYYNSSTGRYEFPVFVQAVNPGASGNISAGALTVVSSGGSVTLQVTNLSAAIGGSDRESNYDLGTRGLIASAGVDSSTSDGLLKAALSVPEVERAIVVGKNSRYMQRDWDDLLRRHQGGKVDIYVKGQEILDAQDVSAMEFLSTIDNTLTILSTSEFQFQVDALTLGLSVGSEHPIFEVTQVHNITKGAYYDVDCTRFSGDTFTLDSTNATNIGIGLDSGDVVRADFRWEDSNPITLQTQPAFSMNSVLGEDSGLLVEGTHWNFNRSEDPLLLGESPQASYYLEMFPGPGEEFVESTELNGAEPYYLLQDNVDPSTIVVTNPAGSVFFTEGSDYSVDTCQRVAFTDEAHTVSVSTGEALDHTFVDTSSITVWFGATPVEMTLDVDYTISTAGSVTSIQAILGGGLTDGDAVTVDYRVTLPIRETSIVRLAASTPLSLIGDGDEVRITYNVKVPDGHYVVTSEEEAVLVGNVLNDLERKGVVSSSIVVTDGGSTTYTEGIDYLVIQSGLTTSIQRLASGGISDGASVYVSYVSVEKLTISYTYNNLIQTVQEAVDLAASVNGDVLVKGSIEVPVDNTLTIVPDQGADSLLLVNDSRTAVSRAFENRELRESLFQANIVNVLDTVDGINHPVIPFIRLTRAVGSLVLRENVLSPTFSVWTTSPRLTYKSQASVLQFIPAAAGGSRLLPRGVYEDDHPLTVVDDEAEVPLGYGRAYISSDGSLTISPVSQDPTLHSYQVTYQIGESTGVYDIRIGPLEHLVLGEFDVIVADPEEADY